MATDKKSALIYCDIIHTVEALEDEEAGRLFKHYLRYINDLNPISDRLTELLFEPIKQTLKRDLKKWIDKSEKNSTIAKEGWIKRKNANVCERINIDAINADSDIVIVNVKDIKYNIEERKLKFASTLKPFLDKYGKEMIRAFYDHWTEPNKSNTKFRQELEKTWGLEKRLNTWKNNDTNFKPKQKQQIYNHDSNGLI
jgi:hypothetical protein